MKGSSEPREETGSAHSSSLVRSDVIAFAVHVEVHAFSEGVEEFRHWRRGVIWIPVPWLLEVDRRVDRAHVGLFDGASHRFGDALIFRGDRMVVVGVIVSLFGIVGSVLLPRPEGAGASPSEMGMRFGDCASVPGAGISLVAAALWGLRRLCGRCRTCGGCRIGVRRICGGCRVRGGVRGADVFGGCGVCRSGGVCRIGGVSRLGGVSRRVLVKDRWLWWPVGATGWWWWVAVAHGGGELSMKLCWRELVGLGWLMGVLWKKKEDFLATNSWSCG